MRADADRPTAGRRAAQRRTDGHGQSRRHAVVRLAVLVLLLAGVAALVYFGGLYHYRNPAELAGALRAARGLQAIPFVFLGMYTLCTAVGLPGTPFMLAGGAIFGLGTGIAFNWIGAVLGATAAYALSRLLGRDAIRRLLGARAARLDRFATEHGFRTVFRLRLIPVIPFIALNYGSGLAGVRLRDYVSATAVGILPAVAIYTYFADALVAGLAGARDRAVLHVALAGALLLLASFAPTLLRRLGRSRDMARGVEPARGDDG